MPFTTYGTIAGCETKDNKFQSRFEGNQGLMNKALEDGAGMGNAALDPRFAVPVPVRTDGTYDQPLVDMNEWFAVALGYDRGRLSEDADRARTQANLIVEGINNSTFALEAQVTLDETGIAVAVPGFGNSSSGQFYVDRATSRYTGDYLVTYIVTIGTGGAVGTATYTATKDGNSLITDTATVSTWASVESGVKIRFVGAVAGSFVSGDTWTIVCRPRHEGTDASRIGSGRLVKA
ncbi:MAG: hypothetical protein V3W37_03130 [Candidatus Binatia bacterium]